MVSSPDHYIGVQALVDAQRSRRQRLSRAVTLATTRGTTRRTNSRALLSYSGGSAPGQMTPTMALTSHQSDHGPTNTAPSAALMRVAKRLLAYDESTMGTIIACSMHVLRRTCATVRSSLWCSVVFVMRVSRRRQHMQPMEWRIGGGSSCRPRASPRPCGTPDTPDGGCADEG